MKAPVRVAVTGAAGQIGYALLFRIASGEMLGKDQPVILQLLEIPDEKAQKALQGRDDGARRLRVPAARRHGRAPPIRWSRSRTPTSRCWSARVRAARAWSARTCCEANAQDLHRAGQGARRASPSRNVKVLVVGNPANTNAYIAMKNAPSLPAQELHRACCASTTTARCRSSPQKTGKPVADDREADRLGQPLADAVPGLPLRRPSTASRSRTMINDQDWNEQHLHPDGRQARRGDHRGARPVVGGVARPTPRSTTCATGCSGTQRRVGDDGRAVRRQLRHSRRT